MLLLFGGSIIIFKEQFDIFEIAWLHIIQCYTDPLLFRLHRVTVRWWVIIIHLLHTVNKNLLKYFSISYLCISHLFSWFSNFRAFGHLLWRYSLQIYLAHKKKTDSYPVIIPYKGLHRIFTTLFGIITGSVLTYF